MEQTPYPLRSSSGTRIGKKLMEEEVAGLELVQMSEETETTVDQILRQYRIKEEQSDRSDRFWNTLKFLNSNGELNMILLQDPNPLLENCLQKLPNLQVQKEKCKSVREGKCRESGVTSGRKQVEVVCAKKFQKENIYQFLWNKIRSSNGEQSTGRENPRTPCRILVDLKLHKGRPDSENVDCHCSFMQSPHLLKNQAKSVKTSYFSFRGMKRKMRCTVDDRKEQHCISKYGSKGIGGKIANRNDKTSVDVKMKDSRSETRLEIASPKECSHKKLSSSSVHFPKRRDIDIYLEAKRDISKRLNENFSGKEYPKRLDRMPTMHQHDFLLNRSPEWVVQSGFVTSQTIFSPYSNFCGLQEDKISCRSSSTQNKGPSSFAGNRKFNDQMHIFGSKQGDSEHHSPDKGGPESISSIADDFSSNCYMKNDDFNTMEERTTISSCACITSPRKSANMANMSKECGYLECSRPDSPSGSQQLTSSLDVSSPSPSSIQKRFRDSIYDRTENPSPVSVLDPVFLDEITSPPSIATKPVNSTIQPNHIDFEEQYGCLTWDKLFSKWYSSDRLLSPSFFDELELPSSFDQNLLLDYVNEVISEANQCYFSCSPFLFFLKPKLRPMPVDKVVGHEIKKRVNLFLRLSPSEPRRLDEIVGEDLASSSNWMDNRHDVEGIVVHMVESILDELIPEAVPDFHI